MTKNVLSVKIKKLNDKANVPSYAKFGDAGMDITATSIEYIADTDSYSYGTGLAFEIPEGYVGLLFPRSSLCKKHLLLSNAVGVLDSGYRGEVKFIFKNNKDTQYPNIYNIGDRIGQLIVLPYPQVQFQEVEELSSSERGEGSFGSSGS